MATGLIAVVANVRSTPHSARVAISPSVTVPKVRSTSRPTTTTAQPATPTTGLRTAAISAPPLRTTPPQENGTTSSPITPAPAPQPVGMANAPRPTPAAAPLPEVAIYGDSLTVLSESRYHEIADSEVDTHVHAFAGASLPDHAKIILADSVNRLVLALGTNDAHRQGAQPWRDFFNAVPATKCIVWPKPYEGSNEVRIFNAQVAPTIATHTNVHIIDWDDQAKLHPEWIGPDHVHYTDAGRVAYADMLKQAALTCP